MRKNRPIKFIIVPICISTQSGKQIVTTKDKDWPSFVHDLLIWNVGRKFHTVPGEKGVAGEGVTLIWVGTDELM